MPTGPQLVDESDGVMFAEGVVAKGANTTHGLAVPSGTASP
ncbi:hypothetical protein [Mycobacterium sp. 155]|nr:hypothetical protein [Mycobacterium sp. 155]